MQRLHLAITGGLAVAVVVLGVLLWRQGRIAGEPPPAGATQLDAADDPAVGTVVPKDPASDAKAIEGLWSGSWGGGERGGVIFQPVIAELFIQGDYVELSGFRNADRLTGTVRFDPSAGQMHITPAAEAGAEPTSKAIDYAYEIKGDELTLTGSDKISIFFKKHPVAQHPLANAQVDLVATTGINDAGDLLVTEFTELRVGRAGATYFQPQNRSLKTKQATVLLAQETGLKNGEFRVSSG